MSRQVEVSISNRYGAMRIRGRAISAISAISRQSFSARHESAATRTTVHRRRCVPGACAAPLGRCTWLSASMSRRDLNFPTLGRRPSSRAPLLYPLHRVYSVRCNYFPPLSARFPSLSTASLSLPSSTSCVRVRCAVSGVRVYLRPRERHARTPHDAHTRIHIHVHIHALRCRQAVTVRVCVSVSVTRSL